MRFINRYAVIAVASLLCLAFSSLAQAGVSAYRWTGTGGVTCSSVDGGRIATGTRDFSYDGLPVDAQLRRQDRSNGVPVFDAGPYDAPDGTGTEDFSPFGGRDMGPYPFIWESEYETLIGGVPAYLTIAVATCYADGPADEVLVNTVLNGDFAINDIMSASWADPVYNGQGFNLEILTAPTVGEKGVVAAPGSVVVYWYTYDAMGFPVWFFGVGFWSGDSIVIPMLWDYDGSGPVFGPGWNTGQFIPTPWGTLIMVFRNCNEGYAVFAPQNGVSFPQHAFEFDRLTFVRGINAPCSI